MQEDGSWIFHPHSSLLALFGIVRMAQGPAGLSCRGMGRFAMWLKPGCAHRQRCGTVGVNAGGWVLTLACSRGVGKQQDQTLSWQCCGLCGLPLV